MLCMLHHAFPSACSHSSFGNFGARCGVDDASLSLRTFSGCNGCRAYDTAPHHVRVIPVCSKRSRLPADIMLSNTAVEV